MGTRLQRKQRYADITIFLRAKEGEKKRECEKMRRVRRNHKKYSKEDLKRVENMLREITLKYEFG